VGFTHLCVAHKKQYVEQTSVMSRRVSTQECSRKVHSQKFDWTYQPRHLLKLWFLQECVCPIGNWYVGVRIQVVHVLLPIFKKGVAFYFLCSRKIASSFRDSLWVQLFVGNKQEVPIVHIVRWLYVRPLAKDPVQAMLLICLQEQMEGNQLVSKANRTFVAHMGIWPDSAGQGERLKQCAA